jgi:hypothetical protein
MSIEEVETLRKKAKDCIKKGLLISGGIGLVLSIIGKAPGAIFYALIIGGIVCTIKVQKPKQEFIRAFKNTFVLKALQSVFTDLVYEPEKGLDESVIRNTQMMNMGDRYSSNDFVSGKYKNINVVQADVHIEEEHESTDSNGHTTRTWVTIFRGKWMIFDFNKTFKANIQVSQKNFGNSRIKNWGQKVKYKKVMMEDQAFNNQFKTFAQDEHDAFYILTPALMERIKKLSSSIQGKLLFCFIDNKLHIGLQNGKDSFEHSIFSEINEEKVTNEIAQDIKIITNFVDELSLDNDLFRREV